LFGFPFSKKISKKKKSLKPILNKAKYSFSFYQKFIHNNNQYYL
jgi:hypothetical protein